MESTHPTTHPPHLNNQHWYDEEMPKPGNAAEERDDRAVQSLHRRVVLDQLQSAATLLHLDPRAREKRVLRALFEH